jgi:N-acetyl sugar amidotransferase
MENFTEGNYQMCNRCLMDTTVVDIKFDTYGNCNYCNEFLQNNSQNSNSTQGKHEKELESFVQKMKEDGISGHYDCVVGVSGGVDSSWVLVKAVELGLRPLAVHMDNGWNSELAQHNIENLIHKLNVDLYTYVIEWDEYKKLMQAFFDAHVIDIEILYDNAAIAVVYKAAIENKVKYILSGSNISTEGLTMPSSWNWYKLDEKNIKDIAWRFGKVRLNSFPSINQFKLFINNHFRSVKTYLLLNYLSYNKEEALEVLEIKYDYKPYAYKHYESIFTRFYQGYILPEKFKVDKRRVHLSTLVLTGQISREEALNKIKETPYPSIDNLKDDKTYFLKKMGWTDEQLEQYINSPEVSHSAYKSEREYWDNFLDKFYPLFLKLKNILRKN